PAGRLFFASSGARVKMARSPTGGTIDARRRRGLSPPAARGHRGRLCPGPPRRGVRTGAERSGPARRAGAARAEPGAGAPARRRAGPRPDPGAGAAAPGRGRRAAAAARLAGRERSRRRRRRAARDRGARDAGPRAVAPVREPVAEAGPALRELRALRRRRLRRREGQVPALRAGRGPGAGLVRVLAAAAARRLRRAGAREIGLRTNSQTYF